LHVRTAPVTVDTHRGCSYTELGLSLFSRCVFFLGLSYTVQHSAVLIIFTLIFLG